MIEQGQILMVAGEPSADLHGAAVIRELKKQDPSLHIFGIGGEKMRAAGQEQLYTTRQMAIIGFVEILRHLPFFYRVMRHLVREVQRRRPVCAILIDYPGFNLKLAKKLKQLGIPILYYIAPQVWAWGARRIPRMAKFIDHLAVVFPFEVPLFEQAGLPTTFVGHPLLEGLQPEYPLRVFQQKYALSKNTLGLLPGSRKQEVERLLPDMLRTARLLQGQLESLSLLVARAADVQQDVYQKIFRQVPVDGVQLVSRGTYSVMKYSTACMVASGTATLETACFVTPFVIVYRVSPLTYQLGRRLVKLDRIGLANIVAGEQVAPEFVQEDFQPQVVAETLLGFFRNPELRNIIQKKLRRVREKLGEAGASRSVAELALRLAWPKQN